MPDQPMPALTLWQPWASLLIGGYKRHETRSWKPAAQKTRFWCAIHAAKQEPKTAKAMFRGTELGEAAAESLHELGYNSLSDLPRGQILGLVLWGTIRPTKELQSNVNDLDLLFGDWSAGRFAWQVQRIWALPNPVPARGKQGLWTWQMPSELYASWIDHPRQGESAQ